MQDETLLTIEEAAVILDDATDLIYGMTDAFGFQVNEPFIPPTEIVEAVRFHLDNFLADFAVTIGSRKLSNTAA